MRDFIIILITVVLAILAILFLSQYPLVLGGVSAWITTGSFLLQVIHIIKSRETKALSIWMWSALFLGVSCWFGYGLRVGDIPVMVANGITALLALSVISLKIWNERPSLNQNPIKIRKAKNIVFRFKINKIMKIKEKGKH